jgi:DNA polymerase-3 subunit epsilon
MAERQRAIEDAAQRPVESLRALTHDEALRVLSRLGQAPKKPAEAGSAWDQRDEDTWIDRL